MPTVSASPLRRLLGGHWPARTAGPGVDDALRVARRVVSSGRLVSLEHAAAAPEDDAAELEQLIERVTSTGLGPSCELLVPVGRLGVSPAGAIVAAARGAGLGVVLAGRPAQVGPLAGEAGTTVLVPAGAPGAEARCRALAGGRVRLAAGRGRPAGLAFVRCLTVLMSGAGYVAVETVDRAMIAVAGERAAWTGRSPESWEYVLPWGVREEEQQRLVAGGHRLRVRVLSGSGNTAPAAVARRTGGGAWPR